jgi:hypothetical protein
MPDPKRYDIALILTVEQDSYEAALDQAETLAENVGNVAEVTISAVTDYETDAQTQERLLRLHPASEPW